MAQPAVGHDRRRSAYLWLIGAVGVGLIFVSLAGALFVPHLIQKRLVRRLEVLGCTVSRKELESSLIPIHQIPGFEDLKMVPFELWVDEKVTPDQCGEILRIASDVTSIKSLQLTNTPTCDEHLRILASGTDLMILSLTNTRVTNESLRILRAAPALTILDLTNCEIDDVGMAEISNMPQLACLELTGTKITDVGLEGLKSLKKLRYLGLSNTQVSESAVKELVRVLPLLEVTDD